MEQVGISKLWSFVDGGTKVEIVTNGRIRQDRGFFVSSYMDLAARVAELQYRNRNHVLFFRGQSGDWRSAKGFTTLKPTLFRPPPGRYSVGQAELSKRFVKLMTAELLLANAFKVHKRLGWQRLTRDRLLRWSILQHYEVCSTPLLDVTQALRIAASFASLAGGDEAFLYVLAVPNLSGAITANAESGLQVLRLSSVCPPAAIRPHIQEGYLLGEYPDMSDTVQSQHYKPHELDLGRRIVAKFRFAPANFWANPAFPAVTGEALYPKGRDWLERLTADIAAKLN